MWLRQFSMEIPLDTQCHNPYKPPEYFVTARSTSVISTLLCVNQGEVLTEVFNN